MGVMSAVLAGRVAAERLMTDTVRVSRGDGDPDPLTGLPGTVTVYEGRGKVQSFRPHEQSFDVVGAAVVVGRREVHVPAGAGDFLTGDVVEVLASRQSNLVGNRYRVAYPDEKTHQTAQRLLVDQ